MQFHNPIKSFCTATATLTLLAFGQSVSAYTLDFDENGGVNVNLDSSPSQTIDTTAPYERTITDNGITWLLSTPTGNGPALFDTTCPYDTNLDPTGCNGDSDLRPASQGENGVSGNILIQQNDKESRTPNDDPNTDKLTLTLMSDVSLVWTGISVIDDGQYDFYTEIGGFMSAVLDTVTLTLNSETSQRSFMSSVLSMGDSVIIDFTRPNVSNGDSGGVDTLTFSQVPVPAGLPLLLGGLGAFTWLGRRRKTG